MPAATDLICARDGVPTKLSCSHCRTPICPACFVRTPVGLQCPNCAPAAEAERRSAKRSRTLRLTGLVAAVVAVGLVVALPRVLGGDGDGDGGEATDSEVLQVDASAPDGGLGQEVEVGPLAITVTEVRCPGGQIGTPPNTRQAGGRFCAVVVEARNTATQPEYFGASIQQLSDGTRRYEPSLQPTGSAPPTTVVLEDGTRELLGIRLNPDQVQKWALVFDVPPNFEPAQLLLRFTPRSAVVRVALTA